MHNWKLRLGIASGVCFVLLWSQRTLAAEALPVQPQHSIGTAAPSANIAWLRIMTQPIGKGGLKKLFG